MKLWVRRNKTSVDRKKNKDIDGSGRDRYRLLIQFQIKVKIYKWQFVCFFGHEMLHFNRSPLCSEGTNSGQHMIKIALGGRESDWRLCRPRQVRRQHGEETRTREEQMSRGGRRRNEEAAEIKRRRRRRRRLEKINKNSSRGLTQSKTVTNDDGWNTNMWDSKQKKKNENALQQQTAASRLPRVCVCVYVCVSKWVTPSLSQQSGHTHWVNEVWAAYYGAGLAQPHIKGRQWWRTCVRWLGRGSDEAAAHGFIWKPLAAASLKHFSTQKDNYANLTRQTQSAYSWGSGFDAFFFFGDGFTPGSHPQTSAFFLKIHFHDHLLD